MIKNKAVVQRQHLLALMIIRKTKDKLFKKYLKAHKAIDTELLK